MGVGILAALLLAGAWATCKERRFRATGAGGGGGSVVQRGGGVRGVEGLVGVQQIMLTLTRLLLDMAPPPPCQEG